MTALTIRRATQADAPAIGKLGAHLVELHHSFDPQRFIPPSRDTAKHYGSYLVSQLRESTVVLLVAERGGEVIGYTYAGVEDYDWMALRGPAGAVYDIVVDPEARGAGVGRALLEATLRELKQLGAPRVVLSTAERNDTAQRLFEHAGFRRTMIEMTRELD